MFISLAAAIPGSRTERLKPRRFAMPSKRWLFMKWLEAPLTLTGSMMKVDGAGMNESPMAFEADVDELVVVVTVER